ncbi:hypothetical protein SAMN05661080_01666 [Modestobacter sp. DSM 44400]|uniref:hypothetical protein n=1 Tax=Modestobacter sp. DSM 44400 TaxID=1550230 RepID=UPI0008950D92|nr:hypothetical protein [Modestobacter sp. DSM 44400]SDX90846.1 hypothetical protein SAMN05661080_01666 [Modestobacter sp. DSM 44400]
MTSTIRADVPVRAVRPRFLDRATVLTALGLGVLTVSTWPLVLAALGPGLSLMAVLAHVCGMLAGYGVLVLLLFVSRTPALEQGIGADVLARWHARGGRAVVGLVVVHGGAAIAAWAQARNEGVLAGAWEVLGMPALPAATAPPRSPHGPPASECGTRPGTGCTC